MNTILKEKVKLLHDFYIFPKSDEMIRLKKARNELELERLVHDLILRYL